jgi:hypothetical protein
MVIVKKQRKKITSKKKTKKTKKTKITKITKKSIKKTRKFGSSGDRCCDEIAQLKQEINIKLNNLENIRTAFGIDVPESIKAARELINNADTVLSLVEDQLVDSLIAKLNTELSQEIPDYEKIANDIAVLGKHLNNNKEVADMFSGGTPPVDNNKRLFIKQLGIIKSSDSKLDELKKLYKMIFFEDIDEIARESNLIDMKEDQLAKLEKEQENERVRLADVARRQQVLNDKQNRIDARTREQEDSEFTNQTARMDQEQRRQEYKDRENTINFREKQHNRDHQKQDLDRKKQNQLERQKAFDSEASMRRGDWSGRIATENAQTAARALQYDHARKYDQQQGRPFYQPLRQGNLPTDEEIAANKAERAARTKLEEWKVENKRRNDAEQKRLGYTPLTPEQIIKRSEQYDNDTDDES